MTIPALLDHAASALRNLDEAYCEAGPHMTKAQRDSGRRALIKARSVLADIDRARANGSVLSGYKVVPIEATDEMCEAAWDSNAADYIGEHKVLTRADLVYKAMLSAAPPIATESTSQEARNG